MDHIVGTALPSIISIFSAALEVCITDHPSSPALTSGAIQPNVQESIELAKSRNQNPLLSIDEHEWGSVTDAVAMGKRQPLHQSHCGRLSLDAISASQFRPFSSSSPFQGRLQGAHDRRHS